MTQSLSAPDQATRPLAILAFAVWFGLIAGLAEVCLVGVKKFALGQIVRVGPEVVWMAPVADVFFLLVPGVLLAIAARWRPTRQLLQVALTAFGFVWFLSVLLQYSQVTVTAKALLALGLAVQGARMLVRRAAPFYALVRRTTPWLAALVVVLFVGMAGWQWRTADRAIATLPASSSGAPNVILIVLDTVRARSLSLHGYGRQTTPNLDRWAETAAVFDRAIAPSPWTFPSHATLFTGRFPHELFADWHRPLDTTYPTLAEVLRDKGYLTAGFVANTFWCTTEFGLARGFGHFDDYPVSPSQTLMSSTTGRELLAFSLNEDFAFKFRTLIGYDEIPGRRNAAQITDAFLDWQADQESGRPFFAFLNYLDAHQPFLAPEPFGAKFSGDAPRGDPRHWWDRQWTPDAIQAETDAYDGTIAYVDHQLGLLFEALRRRGQLENTLIVITSDHGEHLGEHGFMRHGNTLYLEVLHVPLLIGLPGRVDAGVRVTEPVTLRDVPATVLDLVGQDCAGCLPGRPLTWHWTRQDPAAEPGRPPSPILAEVTRGVRLPDRYPSAKGDMQSLLADNLHYIVNGDGSDELYDLSVDPAETRNLVADPGRAAARENFRRALEALRQPGRGSGPAPRGPVR